jgi:hypothetical protein
MMLRKDSVRPNYMLSKLDRWVRGALGNGDADAQGDDAAEWPRLFRRIRVCRAACDVETRAYVGWVKYVA